MADIRFLVKRTAPHLGGRAKEVEAKAAELLRLATAKLGTGGLGQGELCKGAVCIDLACSELGIAPTDALLLTRLGCVPPLVFASTRATLVKALGLGSKATAADLCAKFGCRRLEGPTLEALAAWKTRYVRRLPEPARASVDFQRPVFLAAAFYLVARKNRVTVDRTVLLPPLGILDREFDEVLASMADLLPELGAAARAAAPLETARGLIERAGAAAEDDEVACSSDEEVLDEEHGLRINKAKQQRRDYDEWKERMLADQAEQRRKKREAAAAAAAGEQQQQEGLPAPGGAKKLKQATLSFGIKQQQQQGPACVSNKENV